MVHNTLSEKRKQKVRFWIYEVIFCGVILVMFVLMKVLPFLMSIGYSFTDWNGVSGKVSFVLFDNFKRLAKDVAFWNSLKFTVKFCIASIFLVNVIGFALAYLLTREIRFRNILRAGFYLPNVMGGLVLGFIWQFVFLKIVPAVGQATGISLFNLLWLATPSTAFWGLVIVQAWNASGYYMLLYIAGFTSIPMDCVESARIDGAGGWSMLCKVIIPLMMPTITRCTFLSVISSFKIYTLNYALTNGGPYQSSESIAMDIYRTAFTQNSMGYGSAKALIFTLLVVAVTTLQLWLTSRKEVEM